MKNIGAFFDIDGTIFRNSLMIEHFKKLNKYEMIDPTHWYTDVKPLYEEWNKRQGDFESYLEALAEVYITALKGISQEYVDFISRQVININGDMVYSFSRERIEWHIKKGHLIFFISGSPDFLVAKMAEKYGATAWRATRYLVDGNNRFTGELDRMWDSISKSKSINELVEEYEVDMSHSYAYGDTQGDLSMLRSVGHPVAINPNRMLINGLKEDENLKDRVEIVVERKNVIYKLKSDVEII